MIRRIDIKGIAGPMRVLLIPKGEVSPNFPAVVGNEHLFVEFYDARYPKFTPDGQFIARYYVSTFLEGSSSGLDLMCNVPDWKIDGRTRGMVRDWVTYHLYQSPEGL